MLFVYGFCDRPVEVYGERPVAPVTGVRVGETGRRGCPCGLNIHPRTPPLGKARRDRPDFADAFGACGAQRTYGQKRGRPGEGIGRKRAAGRWRWGGVEGSGGRAVGGARGRVRAQREEERLS